MEAALVMRPKSEEPSVAARPLKLGVLVRFWTSPRISTRWRSCGPKRKDLASDMFHEKEHGPSMEPRCSSPYLFAAGAAKAPVLKYERDEPPHIPVFGFAMRSGRRENAAPVPLSDAVPPSKAVNGVPVRQVTIFSNRQFPRACNAQPCV